MVSCLERGLSSTFRHFGHTIGNTQRSSNRPVWNLGMNPDVFYKIKLGKKIDGWVLQEPHQGYAVVRAGPEFAWT